VQQILDMHSKFAPYACGSMVDIQSPKLRLGEEKRRRKKKKKDRRNHRMKI